MAGLKDVYKNKPTAGYKDVFKEEIKKSDYCTSSPIQSLRKPVKQKKSLNSGITALTEKIKELKPQKKSDIDIKIRPDVLERRGIKIVYTFKVKWKIWLTCIAFAYMIFLIYGVSKTTYQYDSKGYSVPVAMNYSDIEKVEEFKSILVYYEECKTLYEKVLKTDYKLAVNPDNSQIIATEYESILDEMDKFLTQLDAVAVKSDYSLLKNMLYNWCANDIAIYLQNIAEALTINSQTKAEQAITYRTQSKVDFETITKNFSSVAKTMKGVDVSALENWTADEYYYKLEGSKK